MWKVRHTHLANACSSTSGEKKSYSLHLASPKTPILHAQDATPTFHKQEQVTFVLLNQLGYA